MKSIYIKHPLKIVTTKFQRAVRPPGRLLRLGLLQESRQNHARGSFQVQRARPTPESEQRGKARDLPEARLVDRRFVGPRRDSFGHGRLPRICSREHGFDEFPRWKEIFLFCSISLKALLKCLHPIHDLLVKRIILRCFYFFICHSFAQSALFWKRDTKKIM